MGQPRRHRRGEGSIYQRKDGRWCARLTTGYVDGKRIQKTAYGQTRQEAAVKLAQLRQMRSEGRPVLDSSMRLDAYLDRWVTIVARPRLRQSSYESYQANIRLHINPQLGHIALNKLTANDVREFVATKRQEMTRRGMPLSPRSIRYIFGILRVALNDAMREEMISRNVVQLVRAPGRREGVRAPEFLTADQARAVLATAAGTRLAAMWRLAITGGLRQGELLALCWEDVDLRGGRIMVRRSVRRVVGSGLVDGEPKSRSSRRTIRIGPGMVESLRQHRVAQEEERSQMGERWRDIDRVFTTPIGTTLDTRNVSRDYKDLCFKAGVPRMRFHSLRHTCAALLLSEGESLEVIADRLGHCDTRTTSEVYAHIIDTHRERAADRLDSMFG